MPMSIFVSVRLSGHCTGVRALRGFRKGIWIRGGRFITVTSKLENFSASFGWA